MTTRRKAANTGNSSPAVTRSYVLRDRTIHAGQQSDHSPSASTITNSEAKPQTRKAGNKDDISDFTHPIIKTATVKVTDFMKTKHTRSTAKPVEPDVDVDSDESDQSSRSKRSSQHETQSSFPTSDPPIRRSARKQLSSPFVGDIQSPLLRPPIAGASARYQPSQAKQDDDGRKHNEEEKWRETERSHSSSEDVVEKETFTYQQKPRDDDGQKYSKEESWRDDFEKETFTYQQKPRGQLKETTYREERQTLRSRIHGEGSVPYQILQPKDRGEGSVLYERFQQKPKEMQTFQARKAVVYSDDDEEETTRYEDKIVFHHRNVEGDKRNHHSGKSFEQKAVIIRKHPTKSYIRFVGTCMKYLVLALLALLVAAAAIFYISPASVLKVIGPCKFLQVPQVKKDVKDDFGNLTSIFTNQSPVMWQRSQRIMELHLEKWDENKEPAIILLAGARDAEQTLLCLGTRLAKIYSSSRNGNYSVISGSDWVSGSSEQVKEYIDGNLNAGFQATTKATVLHRLELLPAGSLLILYKYCDHETAVFKNVMILLTVLLDDPTLEKKVSLPDLEEKVRAFLIQKLIDSNNKPSHDGMDEDKFSGVWSRISHVVLPVFPEKNVMEKCSKKQD